MEMSNEQQQRIDYWDGEVQRLFELWVAPPTKRCRCSESLRSYSRFRCMSPVFVWYTRVTSVRSAAPMRLNCE